MNQYRKAIAEAKKQGYLVSGSGGQWLTCEIAWRRYCAAHKRPTVVVTVREKYANVYAFLRNVPHADASDEHLYRLLRKTKIESLDSAQINIIRGRHGEPNLLMGLSVDDIPIDDALELAPILLYQALHLVVQKQKEASAGT